MKITISRGATINLEHYESARIDLTVESDEFSEEQSDGDDVVRSIDNWVCELLEKRIVAIRSEAGLLDSSATKFTGRRE